MATHRRPIYRGYIPSLLQALKRLRVWESQWSDLSYPDGDPRKAIPDNEQPAEVITERDYLRREVVRYAALIGGEDHESAIMFADTPLAATNPYNLDRVADAVAIFIGERL
jgi:hypothetical protein